jgi:hypothetical protein
MLLTLAFQLLLPGKVSVIHSWSSYSLVSIFTHEFFLFLFFLNVLSSIESLHNKDLVDRRAFLDIVFCIFLSLRSSTAIECLNPDDQFCYFVSTFTLIAS